MPVTAAPGPTGIRLIDTEARAMLPGKGVTAASGTVSFTLAESVKEGLLPPADATCTVAGLVSEKRTDAFSVATVRDVVAAALTVPSFTVTVIAYVPAATCAVPEIVVSHDPWHVPVPRTRPSGNPDLTAPPSLLQVVVIVRVSGFGSVAKIFMLEMPSLYW